jgi:hypothetical protein
MAATTKTSVASLRPRASACQSSSVTARPLSAEFKTGKRMSDDVYDEIITEFYGIDPASLKVDNVAVTRTGTISHWTAKRGYTRYPGAGPDARETVVRIFEWMELVELHPQTPNHQRLKILMDLQAKAVEISKSI